MCCVYVGVLLCVLEQPRVDNFSVGVLLCVLEQPRVDELQRGCVVVCT